MKVSVNVKIKSDPYLQRYIRENSYWYKLLNRNPDLIREMTEEMRKAYKLTMSDKIDEINSKVSLLRTFMDAIK